MGGNIMNWYSRLKSAASRQLALGCLCALLAACSEPAPTVWTETSRGIEVGCFEGSEGSMRFVATRDQLSAAQIDLLSRLTVTDAVPGCADGMECSLSVGQGDGSTRQIDAIETNSACGSPRKVVSFETFDAFRRSLGCQYAKDLTFGQPIAAAPVPVDVRCFNGLFTTTDGSTIAVVLQVDDSTSHHIELDDCAQSGRAGKLSFSLLDSDGSTVLGTSSAPTDAGPNGTCAFLDQTFPHTGQFVLDVVATPGLLPAGDLSLRFY